jgi:hypothetical protein
VKKLIDKIFLTDVETKTFTLSSYIKDIENNKFLNKMNLGVSETQGGSWQLVDFTQSPNGLFVGNMGTGKSVGCHFTLLTWLLQNSDHTIVFVMDVIKGAQEYKELFSLEQVYEVLNSPEGIKKTIDLIFEESERRQLLFNELGCDGVKSYEKKTGKQMTRIVLVMEEYHAIPQAVLNYDRDHKEEGTHAYKYHTLMRVGRSQGIWFLAASQKGTKADVPTQISGNFTQKQIFNVPAADSRYLLGKEDAARIPSHIKGRCITEYGEVQFPYIPEEMQKALIKKFVGPNTAESAYLTPEIIEGVLKGSSSKELLKIKKYPDLVKHIDSMGNATQVLTLILEAIGQEVEELNAETDKYRISHIITTENNQRIAVSLMTKRKKILEKHVNTLAKGMHAYNCSGGIIYASTPTPSNTVYKQGLFSHIEIVDHEDFIHFARMVQESVDKNMDFEFNPSEIADSSKEENAKLSLMSDEEFSDIYDSIDNDSEIETPPVSLGEITPKVLTSIDEIIENNPLVLKVKKTEDTNVDEIEDEAVIETPDIVIPKMIEASTEPEIKEKKKSTKKVTKKVTKKKIADKFLPSFENVPMDAIQKITRPVSNPAFKLKEEDLPTLFVHPFKNESSEVYRVLFLVSLNNKEHHMYYLDKKITGEFSLEEKSKLGLSTYDSISDWNNDPFVLSEEDFLKGMEKFLYNFTKCDAPAFVVASRSDADFIEEYISKDPNIVDIDSVSYLEDALEAIYGEEVPPLKDIISEQKLIPKKRNIYEALYLDFMLWNMTN